MLKWEVVKDAYIRHDGEYRVPEERIGEHRGTWRAKVPGGWFVRFGWCDASGDNHPMIYYPDPKHDWDGSSLD